MPFGAHPSPPLSVYVAYADADEALWRRLEKHLSLLTQQGVITMWNTRCMLPGEERTLEIQRHIEAAHLVLLLVSADFFASEHSAIIEVSQAIQRSQNKRPRIIPILLRPVDWQSTPIGGLQPLPTDGRPITNWIKREDAYSQVAAGIREIVATLVAAPVLSQPSQEEHGEDDHSSSESDEQIRTLKHQLLEVQQHFSLGQVYTLHNEGFLHLSRQIDQIRLALKVLNTSRGRDYLSMQKHAFQSVDRAYGYLEKAREEIGVSLYMLDEIAREQDIVAIATGVRAFYATLQECSRCLALVIEEIILA